MAKMSKPFYACALLIVLILGTETIALEGRILMEKRSQHQNDGNNNPTAEVQGDNGSIVAGAEDARPTAPGHSPGVGHSLGNKGVDKNVLGFSIFHNVVQGFVHIHIIQSGKESV
ncbi:uncharacterized protein A4U43_C03F19150 [Asparagus officinalis]|uniref:Uncharacterized protein n=1 Tax=Asparagus officinalis TaxID=4686 RepID=A0A5P1FC92_ASPOF|nr:uncharacterized protein A4U43_C03F19150 [Asparagus officinalis]